MSRLFPEESSSGSSSSGGGGDDGQQQAAEDDGQSETSTDGDAESRRYRAYLAARRRLKFDGKDT